MTLEDFFTLTEMSTGLTTPARVQELVSIMQKEKDFVVKNAGEITRQWSAVASTIAATDNKECLELFIQLDGLCFIDCWLKDAQKFGCETSDNIEESITHLLQAVERLHVDNEKSVSSGIRETVKSFLGHKSSKVQERARALFDSWETGKYDDAVPLGVEKVQESIEGGTRAIENLAGENGQSEPSPGDMTPSGGSSREDKCEEHFGDNNMPSSRSDDVHPSGVRDTKTSDQNLEHTIVKDGTRSSPVAKPLGDDQKVEHPTYHAEGTTNAIDPHISAGLRHCSLAGQIEVPVLEPTNYLNHIQEVRSTEKLDSAASEPLEDKTISSGTDARDASDAVGGPDLQKQTDIKDEDSCRGKSSDDGASVVVSEGKTLMDDSGPASHGRSYLVLGAEDRKCNIDILQDSSYKHILEHPKDLGTILSKVDDSSGDDSDKSADDQENDTRFEESQTVGIDSGVFGKKIDMELDYGIMDPLEVARQVAIEVEKEVEQSCSSSEEVQKSKINEPDSADSMSARRFQNVETSKKEVPRGMSVSTEASLPNSEPGSFNGTAKLESIQVTDASLDLDGAKAEKGLCDFDLNLDVSSDEIDRPGDPVSSSISVVSASRAVAAPGVPAAPLRFEGTLGWKGSAATSAFRRASPRRIPESDKAVSSGGSDSSSKLQQGCLEFDLNVAEGGDEKPADLIAGGQVPFLSALPSGESSVDTNPKKLDRLDLDLNCASEEGEAPSDWRMEQRLFPERNGHWSQSPSSSSSSKQLPLRNFDLNDQPSFHYDSSDLSYFKKPSQNINPSGGIRSGDSVVSIMGMKVEVKRKSFVPQSFPFSNGKLAENPVDLNGARNLGVLGMGSSFPCTPSPAYGYNGITSVPAMPFSSSMYGPGGPIPYMVDSRGAPVLPQIVGSAPALPPSFSQQPFFVSMTAPMSNGVGPSRSGLDLNTGLILEGGGNRELGGMRQFFSQGPARSMDEHLRMSSQPSTSSHVGEKRKEPDGGWEHYPFKHHPPPWK